MAIVGNIQKLYFVAFFGIVCVILLATEAESAENVEPGSLSTEYKDESHKMGVNSSERYKILTFNFHHVEVPYVICLWILLASVAKIGFHLYDKLPHIFPESCLLITLGILVGVTLYFTETASSQQYSLDANTFFLFLLPPIIYDAGYHMPNRAFFNNMGTILLLAVVNTLWNTFGIGVGLWGMSSLGWIDQKISIFNCLVFSALISAVDPVAVLAIFEEIQVNEILYILVFGESLLNDGVTVVLYRMMEGFTAIGENNVQLVDFASGFVQFFVVVIGGTLIGVIYGLIGAFITKYTDHVRVIEPLFIFVLGYLAYLTAEIMALSSILALTFGGIIMRHYTEANMTKKSATTVKYFMKMMATISETIIFMFLGLSTVIDSHEFHLDFILFSLLFCLIFRVTGVVMLSFIVNRRRLIRLTAIDQFIMSYGGLRGGIAFCLALLLNRHHIPEKAMFVTTTTVIVFFTVFIQGITIKPVVNALKVEKAEEIDPSMNEMIHKRFIDHLMAGVEDIVGRSGHNSFQHKFDYYNTKYLKPLLLREKPKGRNPSIMQKFTKLSVQDAKAAVLLQQGLSRDHSFISCSPSATNLFRRATIAAPHSRNQETIINLVSTDPMVRKPMRDDLVMHHVLEDSLIEPRNRWVWERRHTLSEVHNHPSLRQLKRDSLKHLISGAPYRSKVSGVRNGIYHSNNVSPAASLKWINKTVSFSDVHQKQRPSDGAEMKDIQESSCQPLNSNPSQLVLNLGMPAPTISSKEVSKPGGPLPPSPHTDPAPSPGEASNRHQKLDPPANSCLSTGRSSNTGSSAHTPASNDAPLVASKASNDVLLGAKTASNDTTLGTRRDSNDAPLGARNNIPRANSINIPSTKTQSIGAIFCISYNNEEDKKDNSDHENECPGREETLVESTFPWRRQTSLPPLPSSVSLSLPDDENPLMSEAPSWADNLAYNHLTESGSPYHSPQNTITPKPAVTQPRSVFELFPPSSPQLSDGRVSSIPPPWSIKDSSPVIISDEPLPSHSVAGQNFGDKASCLLVSSHDLVPPFYHSCLQPTTSRTLETSSSHRHSEASSPTHFQFMQKPDAVSAEVIESDLIGIEADYHHGMKDRVSQWLANSNHDEAEIEDIEFELSKKEEGQKILESLWQKKFTWSLGDNDDGTDADVESDNEIEDTKF